MSAAFTSLWRATMATTTSTRRLRAFRRWMAANAVECSEALEFVDAGDGGGVFVRSRCDLKEGDLVATIPKPACLTIKASGGRDIIEAAGLDGCFGLSVAVMYEKSLGSRSPWAGYLQLLPSFEPLPLVWTLEEVDSLLLGTELHKTVKEDKALVYSDWEECILPLIDSLPSEIDPKFFGVEEFFAAKSLVASRSFQIDDYYGSGMVPLADLFNHKTGAEHVHFTTTPSHLESDDDSEGNDDGDAGVDDNDEDDLSESELDVGTSDIVGKDSAAADTDEDAPDGAAAEGDDPTILEMILVKDVKAGEEVFNTYGLVGNAALLHRYGFTEPDNVYDIINIDLDLVSKYTSSTFSSRHTRTRTSLWRKLGYSGCITEDSEYFEISYNGEPQPELLILLYLIFSPDEAYNSGESLAILKPEVLLTNGVRKALVALADLREGLYGNGFEEDVKMLRNTCCVKERKRYHALTLRVSERRILRRMRAFAKKGLLKRKRMKP